MKKLLLQYILLLLPVFAFAQGNPPIYKDFTPKIMGITSSFKFNDHVSIIQTNIDDQNFELVAVNDKMEVLWRTTLKGYPIGAGKFKGQILAVTATAYETQKSIISPYNGYLINEETGKVTLQKVIYSNDYDKKQWAKLFISDNDANFSFLIGQTDNGKLLPGVEMPYVETKNLVVINLNEKLEAINTKNIVPNGDFVGLAANNKTDLFVFVIQEDKKLQVSKYEANKTEPSGSVVQDIDLNDKSDIKYNNPYGGRSIVERNAWASASPADKNIVYFASVHKKNYEKDYELTVCKINFSNQSGQLINEVFDEKHVTSIVKSYVPFNKKFDKMVIDYGKFTAVRFMAENNDMLIVAVAGEYNGARQGVGDQYFADNSIIINRYDLNLKQKFQNIMPSNSEWLRPLHTDYHFENNSLYLIANTGKGYTKSTIYGQLDLITGNWLKMEMLDRKGIGNYEYGDRNTLWFTNGFILPYVDLKNFVTTKKIINLASYSY